MNTLVARPDFRHTEFSIEDFIKNDLRLRLDSDSQLCPSFISTGSCALGSGCPFRHSTPSVLNFQPKPPIPTTAHARTVCKHWLRGLCKKGQGCEFMHEYHLRKMPECWFFAKYGFCSNGDECMYLHVTENMRVRECPQYRKGFCRNGPNCKLKHIRRVICPDYLIGFCQKGPECPLGHPKFDPDPDAPPSSTRIPDVSGARFLPEASFRLNKPDWLAFAADPRSSTNQHNQNSFNLNQGGQQNWNERGRKDLSNILCYKCSQYGHFANNCSNPNVPGDRGGLNKAGLPQSNRY